MLTLKNEIKVPGSGVLTYHFSAGSSFPLRDAIRLMIAYSDNTATNMVLDAIGLGATAATMESMGYPHTKIHSKVFHRETSIFPKRSEQFGLGSTTAFEMVWLCEALYYRRLVNSTASQAMLEHMRACDDKDKFPRFLPPGTKIAFKTGSLADTRTAAGIIECAGGPVALCVLSSENQDQRWVPDNAGNLLCAGSPARSSHTSSSQSTNGIHLPRPRPRGARRSGPGRAERSARRALSRPSEVPVAGSRNRLPQLNGQRLGLALAVDARQRGMPLGQQGSITEQLIIVHDLDVCHPHHACPEEQEVIIVRRAFEFAADIDDHQIMTGILDLAIGQTHAGGATPSARSRNRQSNWRDEASPCGPSRHSEPGWLFRNYRSCQTGSGFKFELGGTCRLAYLVTRRGLAGPPDAMFSGAALGRVTRHSGSGS